MPAVQTRPDPKGRNQDPQEPFSSADLLSVGSPGTLRTGQSDPQNPVPCSGLLFLCEKQVDRQAASHKSLDITRRLD